SLRSPHDEARATVPNETGSCSRHYGRSGRRRHAVPPVTRTGLSTSTGRKPHENGCPGRPPRPTPRSPRALCVRSHSRCTAAGSVPGCRHECTGLRGLADGRLLSGPLDRGGLRRTRNVLLTDRLRSGHPRGTVRRGLLGRRAASRHRTTEGLPAPARQAGDHAEHADTDGDQADRAEDAEVGRRCHVRSPCGRAEGHEATEDYQRGGAQPERPLSHRGDLAPLLVTHAPYLPDRCHPCEWADPQPVEAKTYRVCQVRCPRPDSAAEVIECRSRWCTGVTA